MESVKDNERCLTVDVDMSQYSPDLVEVNISESEILVSAERRENIDDNLMEGYLSQCFTRRYSLPEGMKVTKSLLSEEDGLLTIEAHGSLVQSDSSDDEQEEEDLVPIVLAIHHPQMKRIKVNNELIERERPFLTNYGL